MRLSTLFSLAILAIPIAVMVMSLGYPLKAKLFPLVIAIPVVVLQIVQIITEIRTKTVPQENGIEERVTSPRYLEVIVWIAVLLLSIYLVGLLMGLSLFTLLYLKQHRQSWLLSLCMSAGVALFIYGGFVAGFKMELYEGLLFM